MNFFIYLVFGLSVVLCSISKNAILDRFENEFNCFFDESILPKASDSDDLLHLLDYPDSLLEELHGMDTLSPSDLVSLSMNHLKKMSQGVYIQNPFKYRKIRDSIFQFCRIFEASFVVEKPEPVGSLLFPVEVDFVSYYYKNVPDMGGTKPNRSINIYEEKWQLIISSLDQVSGKGPAFIRQCASFGCAHLYMDYEFFFNYLKESVQQVYAENVCANEYCALMFISQTSDCYFGARYHGLSAVPNGPEFREGFIRDFKNEVEGIWLAVMERFEELDGNTSDVVDSSKDWKNMAERILTVKSVFENSRVPPIISAAGVRAIESISRFCILNLERKIPFDVVIVKDYAQPILEDFFNVFEGRLSASLAWKLNEKLCQAFDLSVDLVKEPTKPPVVPRMSQAVSQALLKPTDDNKFKQMQNENRQEIAAVLNDFILVTSILSDNWIKAQLFQNDSDLSTMFAYEIPRFTTGLKRSARNMSFQAHCGEFFVISLKELVADRMKMTDLIPFLLEIFEPFAQTHFQSEFFDKYERKYQEEKQRRVEEAEKQHQQQQHNQQHQQQQQQNQQQQQRTFTKEQVLEDPSCFIKAIQKNSGIDKLEAISFLTETFSDFIETEFQGANNENLKKLISVAIGNSF